MIASCHDAASGGSITMDSGWTHAPGRLLVERYHFVWNRGPTEARFVVNHTPTPVPRGAILCLTPSQVVSCDAEARGLTAITFDPLFYCLQLHDREVSCQGLLFNGVLGAPVLQPDDEEMEALELLLSVMEDEFSTADSTQAEMLRALLKRFIIKCTRIGRRQLLDADAQAPDVELVRQFSALVEKHFRTHRRVSDYAAMLHRSPKTLANAFRRAGSRSPRDILQERVALEARRLLRYTDHSVNRIGRDLGFDDPAHFSRFFKKRTGRSPADARRAHTAAGTSLPSGKN